MNVLNKFSAYGILCEIRDKDNSDEVDRHIKETFNRGTVSHDTIVFINKYKPLEQLSIFNRIYEKRRSNPLYKNLVNENLSTENKAIAISSLLTQILINDKKLRESGNNSDADLFIDFMSANEISGALNEHFNGDSSKLNNVFESIRNVFKELYKKNTIMK